MEHCVFVRGEKGSPAVKRYIRHRRMRYVTGGDAILSGCCPIAILLARRAAICHGRWRGIIGQLPNSDIARSASSDMERYANAARLVLLYAIGVVPVMRLKVFVK